MRPKWVGDIKVKANFWDGIKGKSASSKRSFQRYKQDFEEPNVDDEFQMQNTQSEFENDIE